jgi:hypothetical protein
MNRCDVCLHAVCGLVGGTASFQLDNVTWSGTIKRSNTASGTSRRFVPFQLLLVLRPLPEAAGFSKVSASRSRLLLLPVSCVA